MTRKLKPVPSWLRQRTLARIFQSRMAVILSNWLFQGMRMMLPVERSLKLIQEALYAVVCLLLFSLLGLRGSFLMIAAGMAAHTLNWLTNGHFFVLMRYCYAREMGYERFLAFPTLMAHRLSSQPVVLGVLAFGSLSRESAHASSDLDVRIITDDTLSHQWIGALLVWRERALAILQGYPLDIYLTTMSRGLEKLRADEPPVILLDPKGIIASRYLQTIRFEDIVSHYASRFVPEAVMSDRPRPRVLIVCSAGGHLMDALLATEGVVMDFDVATFRLPHVSIPAGARALHFLIDPHTSLWKYGVNALQSLWLMLKIRPRVVLTTGAGIAIACALIGKCMGARLIYVEISASVERLSRTGVFLYGYADLFIVQWPELCERYPRAIYGGCVL